MTKFDMRAEIERLGLPAGSFMIMGSGLLHALAIRESNDIDVLVTPEVYEKLASKGWQQTTRPNGAVYLSHAHFDAMADWYGKGLQEMLAEATYVDGLPYMSLEAIYAWKRERGQPKDLADLTLIDNYTSSH